MSLFDDPVPPKRGNHNGLAAKQPKKGFLSDFADEMVKTYESDKKWLKSLIK